jgi:glycosyltransferase involved in cell wall biosynthesis
VHVLFVPSWYPTSEAPLDGIYFAEQAQCLSEHGRQVGVIYPEQQSLRRLSWSALQAKYFQAEWTHAHDVPTLRRYSWTVWRRFPPGQRCRVRSAVRLGDRYVERHGPPDVLHAQSARWAGAAAARLGARHDVPVVLTEHYSGVSRGNMFPWRRPLVREGYRRARVVTAVSPFLQDALAAEWPPSAAAIPVTPNLAPTARFPPPPTPRPAPPPFRFVTIARLTLRKNVGGLLEAFARARLPAGTTLRIVGDGPQRSRLAARATRLGIRDRVQFLGVLDRPDVRRALWNAHAFVLPSRHETFGVVLLEAMATGLPVVATACGGPEALVTDRTGRLVPPDDPAALADALHEVCARWTSYDAAAIRSYVSTCYGPAAFVRRTRALYRRTLHSTA